jgi:hypothetical protein
MMDTVIMTFIYVEKLRMDQEDASNASAGAGASAGASAAASAAACS